MSTLKLTKEDGERLDKRDRAYEKFRMRLRDNGKNPVYMKRNTPSLEWLLYREGLSYWGVSLTCPRCNRRLLKSPVTIDGAYCIYCDVDFSHGRLFKELRVQNIELTPYEFIPFQASDLTVPNDFNYVWDGITWVRGTND